MAVGWAASAGELNATAVPHGPGLSGQPRAAAVDAAHVDVTAFTASLAARVRTHSANAGVADAGYLGNGRIFRKKSKIICRKRFYVPVDVSQFTPVQRSIVRAYIDILRNLHVFIVGGG